MRAAIWLLLCLLLAACWTPRTRPTPAVQSGIDGEDIEAIGYTAFEQLKSKLPISADYGFQSRLRCVALQLIAELPSELQEQPWETRVFDLASVQVYALPGGRIGAHVGLLQLATGDAELAAAVAIELAHLLHDHPRARVSAAFTSEAAVAAVHVFRGADSPANSRTLYALLGLGPQVGLGLSYAATQSAAADRSGMLLLATAGHAPEAAISLLQSASKVPGASAWLGQYANLDQRLAKLQALLPQAQLAYQEAQALGKRPTCDG